MNTQSSVVEKMGSLTGLCMKILGGIVSEKQVSPDNPDKQIRAALLRSRFADTILKAREKALDQVCVCENDSLRALLSGRFVLFTVSSPDW